MTNVQPPIPSPKKATDSDGHDPWQIQFENLHHSSEYRGFYYDTPLIAQIYGRSDSERDLRGSCLPASFEMAVEHLYPPTDPLYDNYAPRSVLGRVRYRNGSAYVHRTLNERVFGGMRYPMNQVMLHDVFRCNTHRMMRTINRSKLELMIAESTCLTRETAREDFKLAELSLRSDIPTLPINPPKSMVFGKYPVVTHAVFKSRDLRTWNLVRSLLQGRTPIITYEYPRPKLTLNLPKRADYPIVTEVDVEEIDIDFVVDEDSCICGHAVVVIGVRNGSGSELEFLINDPGPSPSIELREKPFGSPYDMGYECGSQYWIPEGMLLEGRMGIVKLFEVSRDLKALDSGKIHEYSEFRMGRKYKISPRIKRIKILN